MNTAWTPSFELAELVEAICLGRLVPEQAQRFEELVLADQQSREYYVRYLHLHAGLPRLVSEQSDEAEHERLQEMIFSQGDGKGVRYILPERPEGCFAQNVPDPFSICRWTREYFSQPVPFSILAAAIFMVCLIAILEILPAPTYTPIQIGNNTSANSSTNSPGRQPRDVPKKFNFVARITALHNCRWSPEGLAPIGRDFLQIGRKLKLDSGLLEITYDNGAKLVLEGPVEFKVEKANACRLDLGKLAAKVSERAVGFTVNTPTATIVDLGTEFGVEVEQGGDADVRVFAGVINMTSQSGRSRRIAAGQAARVGQAGIVVREASTNAGQEKNFVRSLPGRGASGLISQGASDNYIAFEAESYDSIIRESDATWLEIMPTGNASGGRALKADYNTYDYCPSIATWKLDFSDTGTYRLYIRASMFETQGDDSYGTNDSFYRPEAGSGTAFGDATVEENALSGISRWMGGIRPAEGTYDWWIRTPTYEVSASDVSADYITFDLGTRERGFSIDRIVLSKTTDLTAGQLDALPNSSIVPEPDGVIRQLADGVPANRVKRVTEEKELSADKHFTND